MSTCRICEGFGSVTVTVPECCGRAEAFGRCRCDCAVPVERTEPCPDCAGYGFIPLDEEWAGIERTVGRRRTG